MSSHASIWLINATQNCSALSTVCRQAKRAKQIVHVVFRGQDRETIFKLCESGGEFIHFIELGDGDFDIARLAIKNDTEIVFLPCVDDINWTDLQKQTPLEYADCLQLLVKAPQEISSINYFKSRIDLLGWRAREKLARRILQELSAWQGNGFELVETIQRWPDPPRWQSIPLNVTGSENVPTSAPRRLTMSSSVVAVISFYRCEEWLHACLTSMSQQTRLPENIVVVDDCSPALPLKLLEPFPNVTLLSTTRNVGPEKILNNIIRATDYDAYMVQDPDDWSSHDRLELSLRTAEHSGADLIGTHEFSIDVIKEALELCAYPPDINHAMSQGIGHYLLHCTGLISRALALRVGGFDEQLKLGADTDFIMRSWHAGRIINMPAFCVFHRLRAGSLTTDDKTGHRSVARTIEAKFVTIRAKRNQELARTGHPPDIIVKQKERVDFIYHQGPKLRLSANAPGKGNPSLTEIKGMYDHL